MQLTDKDFAQMRDYMYDNFGINLAQKRTLIEGRLSNTLTQRGFNSFAEYIDILMRDKTGEEVSVVVSKLTTNFTYFNREQKHFDFMRDKALPEIVPNIRDGNLCIWSAGCSSGEEPYTIVMTLDDFFKGDKRGLDTKVLATDISSNVMGKAKEARYTSDRMTKIPDAWTKKYFTKSGEDTFQVISKVRDEVVFRYFNLMDKEFRFKRNFHIIFCRNVMIYFDAQTRERLANKFFSVLNPGGYLFIGMSETLLNSGTRFEYVSPSIYRKPKK